MTAASEVYKQYMKYYNDFGDIIKETLSRTRQNNRIQSAKTLILCLQQLYQEHLEASISCSASPDISSNSSFNNIKELARRFSLTFGLDQVKSRESVAMMHKDVIQFAFRGVATVEGHPPPNLSFLGLISEFSNKLLKPDKRLVFEYLQRFLTGQMQLSKGSEWSPLLVYRNSLLANEDDESSSAISVFSKECSSSQSKMSSPKRKPSSGWFSQVDRTMNDILSTSHISSTPFKRRRAMSQDRKSQEFLPGSPTDRKKRPSWSSSKGLEEHETLTTDGDLEDGNEEADVDVIDADELCSDMT